MIPLVLIQAIAAKSLLEVKGERRVKRYETVRLRNDGEEEEERKREREYFKY